jgi:signal transduction histidine kinase
MTHSTRRLTPASAVAAALFAALTIHTLAPQALATASHPSDLLADAAERRPAILVLFAEDPSQPATTALEEGLSQALFNQGARAPVLYYEYLDASRFDDQRYRDAQTRFLRDKYNGVGINLLVPVAQSAIEFLRDVHGDLWAGVPILFAATHPLSLEPEAALPGAGGLIFDFSFADALAEIHGLLPRTRHVAVVTGSAGLERARIDGVIDAVRRAGLDAIELAGLKTRDLLARVAELPEHTVTFLAGPIVDGDGRVGPVWSMCEMLSSASNSPTFTTGSTQFLGCGVLGGGMRDFAAIGRLIGERVLSALTAPGGIERVPAARFTSIAFDARQLERWGIDESRLPARSTVAFRRPSLWRDYRPIPLIALAGLVLQSGLIAGLLYERRARRKAEVDSRRGLALAAHSDRKAAMAALTGSIAHELNQPLGSILLNAQAAERLLAAGTTAPDVLQDILRDIREENARASQIVQRHRAMLKQHRLETRPIDIHAVVRESVALVSHEATKRNVRIDLDVPGSPCMVVGDQILLQQVVVNLVLNAMDAMADTPAARRRVTVRSTVNAGAVEIFVRDMGPGLSPTVDGKLFEPFVTTKPDGVGIGLTIARSTIHAHHGTIEGRNDPEGGAAFRFTLPCASASI